MDTSTMKSRFGKDMLWFAASCIWFLLLAVPYLLLGTVGVFVRRLSRGARRVEARLPQSDPITEPGKSS